MIFQPAEREVVATRRLFGVALRSLETSDGHKSRRSVFTSIVSVPTLVLSDTIYFCECLSFTTNFLSFYR